MAYVLGFFAADGYITVNRRGSQYWCLEICDKDLLRDIRAIIGSNHLISTRKGRGNKRDSYRLQIGSHEMCDDLHKLGFWQNKTHGLAVPFVPDGFLRDFIRGYFDGDGHVWAGLANKGKGIRSLSIQTGFTSCSLVFLERIRDRLADQGIKNGRIRQGRGSYYRLVYSVKSSLKMHNFMYNGLTSSLFLQRKRAVFEKIKENAAVAQR